MIVNVKFYCISINSYVILLAYLLNNDIFIFIRTKLYGQLGICNQKVDGQKLKNVIIVTFKQKKILLIELNR